MSGWPTSAGRSVPTHPGQGRRARGRCEIWVQTESVSTLSLREGCSLRPQDKNVFDIVCNCVMLTLLVSGGGWIGKQAFDCRLWRGEAFLWASDERSLDTGLRDGTKRRMSSSVQLWISTHLHFLFFCHFPLHVRGRCWTFYSTQLKILIVFQKTSKHTR